MDTTAFVDRQGLAGYDLGTDHPLAPVNRELAIDLIRMYGMLDRDDVTVLAPGTCDEDLIARVHTPAYMAQVRRYSAQPALAHAFEAGMWGLAAGGDTPAFAGMHEAAVAVCGASVTAAMEVWEGRATRVFSAAGGLHHAFANKANGFCIYNDAAVAIQALLDAGAERVAYVDVDVHHGDGTQFIFYDDPRVLTCSVHESGRYLFPGTGALDERGVGKGAGTSVNIPLPAYAGDGPYMRAIEDVIVPAVRDFAPDIMVTQDGVDPHHQDPLAHLQVRMATFPRLWRVLHDMADEVTDGRWIALGGGGYNVDVLPRAWALLFAEMTGAALPDDIPPEWLTLARDLTGRDDLTARLMDDPEPEVDEAERTRADLEGHEVVDEAIRLWA
jgi:acetoin utilization protein AcuC